MPDHNASLRAVAIRVLAVTAATFALGATPLLAQTAGSAALPDGQLQNETRIAKGDARMMSSLAQGNLGEIEAGKLALDKSQSDDIKAFAQLMIDTHTRALGEVERLAMLKGVVLPGDAGTVNKAKVAALKVLKGQRFDREYARHAGIGAHENTLKLLGRIRSESRDADLQALAGKLQPAVEQNLLLAMELKR